MRKISSFTLTELIIVLIVLAVLVAVGIPIYQYATEKQKIDVCTSHLEAILEALKMYELDNDSLPDTLASAWQGYGDKALAVVWERKKKEGNYTYLAYISFKKLEYFLANIFSSNSAYASFSDFCTDTGFLKCPSDPTPFDGGGTNFSYGLNETVAGDRWEDIPAGRLIVADCDNSTFRVVNNDLAFRHRVDGEMRAEVIDRTGSISDREHVVRISPVTKIPPAGSGLLPIPEDGSGDEEGGGGEDASGRENIPIDVSDWFNPPNPKQRY